MAIKLYDFASSPNCQRVKVVLHEKKLPYETVNIDLRKGDQKKPEYLKLNPYGKVPVMQDGDKVVYESLVINEYLDETYPQPSLFPKNPYDRARARLLIDYGLSQLNPGWQKMRGELGKEEKERNPKVIEEAKGEIRRLLRHLEQALGDKSYFAGDFSLVDAAVIPRFLQFEKNAVLPDPSLPRLGKWLQRMKERPSVKVISG